MNVVTDSRKSTVIKTTGLMFGKLLEPVSSQLFILDMERLVLFHVCLVLEGEVTGTTATVIKSLREAIK